MAYKYKIKEEEGHSKYYPGGKTPGLTTSVMNTILKKIADSGDKDKNKEVKEEFKSPKSFIDIKLQRYPKALAKIHNLIDMIGEEKFTMNMAEWLWDFFNNASFESPVNEAQSNPTDIISVDVPLFIRLLEYSREDAKTDMDLHDVAENIIRLSAEGEPLTMADYDSIVKIDKPESLDESLTGGFPFKKEEGADYTKITITEPMDDATKSRMIKNFRAAGYDAKPNNGGGITAIKKAMMESSLEEDGGGSMSNAAGGYLGKYAYKLPKKQPKLEEETEAPKPNAKNPGATLGAGPAAGKSGVSKNAYVKQFKYKVVPQTAEGTYVQKGSGMEVKKLF